MNSGTHSTVDFLAMRLLHRWIPKWYEAFYDPSTGGFYERLGHSFQPILTGTRRQLTQCRQLSMYSHAAMQPGCPRFGANLRGVFEHIVDRYYMPQTGLWRFSVDDQAQPLQNYCDLYSITFIIFSFSHYYRASGDKRARDLAMKTLQAIDTQFRIPGLPGFAEAVDENATPIQKQRRQNPHMHLLEACLFAHETWGDDAYLSMAGEIVSLFQEYFFSPDSLALHEFFTDDLQPDPETGNRVEPGHYFEWIWLLKRYEQASGRNDGTYDSLCVQLLDWANRYGWDAEYGGIYDVLSPDGVVLADTKRLWPFAEALKANAMMLDSVAHKDTIKQRIREMVGVFQSRYMQQRGFWVEWVARDLSPATDYMPGTTPYHVYFGIMETRRHLHARGGSMSVWSPVVGAMFRVRRAVSQSVRSVRFALKKKRA